MSLDEGGLMLRTGPVKASMRQSDRPLDSVLFTVLVAAVVVLTAVAIVGCGTPHSSGRTAPTATFSTTYTEGGDSIPPLSTPASTLPPSTPAGLGAPVSVTATPPPSTLGGPVSMTGSTLPQSTPGGLGGPVSVPPSSLPQSTPGGLGGPVSVSPSSPPQSTPGGLGGPVSVSASTINAAAAVNAF